MGSRLRSRAYTGYNNISVGNVKRFWLKTIEEVRRTLYKEHAREFLRVYRKLNNAAGGVTFARPKKSQGQTRALAAGHSRIKWIIYNGS